MSNNNDIYSSLPWWVNVLIVIISLLFLSFMYNVDKNQCANKGGTWVEGQKINGNYCIENNPNENTPQRLQTER